MTRCRGHREGLHCDKSKRTKKERVNHEAKSDQVRNVNANPYALHELNPLKLKQIMNQTPGA